MTRSLFDWLQDHGGASSGLPISVTAPWALNPHFVCLNWLTLRFALSPIQYRIQEIPSGFNELSPQAVQSNYLVFEGTDDRSNDHPVLSTWDSS